MTLEGTDAVLKRLDDWREWLLRTVYAVALDYAPKLEAEAKENRPWTDRTAQARRGLKGAAGQDELETWLRLAHTVPYGEWLELANSGQYAILLPTIEAAADDFLQAVINALTGVNRNG